jgi:tripartite-type tricarboxylate transporter receptor subunit TctC
MNRRKFLRLATYVAAATMSGVSRAEQVFPSRPITIIVGYAPGGATDARTRIVAQNMAQSLGQPVLIENVSGSSGSIATTRAIRAAPDGYTLSSGDWSTHVINGATYPLSYDLLNDFEPIAQLSSTPLLMKSRRDLPAADMQELLIWLKAHETTATFATSGLGSPSHVAGLLLEKLRGHHFQFVPYRGGAVVLHDLIAGHVDVEFGPASIALPALRDGKIKAYAVTSAARWAAAPEIPTVAEVGLPELQVSLWGGLWAPKGTPIAVINRLNAAVVGALADPAVRQRLADLGEEIPAREQQTPEALGALQRADMENWWPIIKAAGVKGE